MDPKHFLKDHAYQNIPLNYEEAYSLDVYLMEGCRGNQFAQIQSIAILCALHTKATYEWQWNEAGQKRHNHSLPQNAAAQIAGICTAVFDHDIAKSEFGFLDPDVEYAMDNCGMGGDLLVTANLSCIAAFIAAAAGIPMCKHGSPANADKGRHGSSDFMDLCGINRFAAKAEVEACLIEKKFAYTEALDTRYKMIHQQTHVIAKLPHMNDIIGPITNPLHPRKLTRRIVGVNHLIPPRIVAEAYHILNERGVTALQHGLFIRGFVGDKAVGGIDEVSICAEGTQVAELREGKIREYWLYPQDFGIEPISPEFVSPPSGVSKGDFSLAILKREASEPSLQMAIANAALLFYLAGKSDNLMVCYRLAEEILMSGRAYQKMLEVRQRIPKEGH